MANEGGIEALDRLKSIDLPLLLNPSTEISETARIASEYLFSLLKPYCPKSYFDNLLVQGFDAEQIWQQIDLQTEPLLLNVKRDVKRFFEMDGDEIVKIFGNGGGGGEVGKKKKKGKEEKKVSFVEESEDDDEGVHGFEDIDDMDVDDDEEDEEDDDDDDEDGEEDEEEGDDDDDGGIDDKFFKRKELEEFMYKDEEREFGLTKKKGNGRKNGDDEEDDDDDDEDEEHDELDDFEVDDDGDEDMDKLGQARYEDFFVGKKKKGSKRESRPRDEPEDNSHDDSENDGEEEDNEGFHNQKKEPLSTHEKQLKKLRSKIEQMEKENMEPKDWPMQGEVSATKRPKNSALAIDLDYESNVRPMEITEEVTASLEDLIKKRILEGDFNDVQKAPSLPSKAPKEIKELDENKSKKGLAEVYEEEYVQQTGLGSGPVSSSDELKKEAQVLFDKLCLKLDALSHFHFKPKPVIEDMSIQTNVPALAMEEIAPVAVSDAAMLAPEEVFAGKGDIKEQEELTQAERKRRRANKKRKYKAEHPKKVEKKEPSRTSLDEFNVKNPKKVEESTK
ncbi:hypothetical protein AQUCO_00200098v1 [Aquilegia coerulea]|uniref:U3 small nucleolar ribonucleoprotein protein MPP10 n=1 Tax=Aquilegia coerulea TaxID=218851 RepID=A0A2G5F1J8_AQUCA|nr:hypothetical protein AQUCO_00200098v1 [Aquilegia coerulea]